MARYVWVTMVFVALGLAGCAEDGGAPETPQIPASESCALQGSDVTDGIRGVVTVGCSEVAWGASVTLTHDAGLVVERNADADGRFWVTTNAMQGMTGVWTAEVEYDPGDGRAILRTTVVFDSNDIGFVSLEL